MWCGWHSLVSHRTMRVGTVGLAHVTEEPHWIHNFSHGGPDVPATGKARTSIKPAHKKKRLLNTHLLIAESRDRYTFGLMLACRSDFDFFNSLLIASWLIESFFLLACDMFVGKWVSTRSP
jgi:hypothetical protein